MEMVQLTAMKTRRGTFRLLVNKTLPAYTAAPPKSELTVKFLTALDLPPEVSIFPTK
jgi:hypothetical protein